MDDYSADAGMMVVDESMFVGVVNNDQVFIENTQVVYEAPPASTPAVVQNNTVQFDASVALNYNPQPQSTTQFTYQVPQDFGFATTGTPTQTWSSPLPPAQHHSPLAPQTTQGYNTVPVHRPQSIVYTNQTPVHAYTTVNYVPPTPVIGTQPVYRPPHQPVPVPVPVVPRVMPQRFSMGGPLQISVPLSTLKHSPAPVDCPVCHQRRLTYITREIGQTNHLWGAILCLFVCLGPIAYLVDDWKDVNHFCSGCNTLLAMFHRSSGSEVKAYPMAPKA